jgi:hypothetical protein
MIFCCFSLIFSQISATSAWLLTPRTFASLLLAVAGNYPVWHKLWVALFDLLLILQQFNRILLKTANYLSTNKNNRVARKITFQSFIIHGKAFNDMLLQDRISLDTELRASKRLHPITDRDYDIKIVVFNVSFYLAITLILNCCKICNS